MVREVKFSCETDDGRIEVPFGRDSILDEPVSERPVRTRKRSKRSPRRQTMPSVVRPTTVRPITERRHLAGADWLNDYAVQFRLAK